jgi:hypothetical protein
MVVIAEGTRRLLGNLFELEDLGAKDLKGIAGPVRAWAALRASSAEGRFEALHTTGLTALVGREEELELLLRRWSRQRPAKARWCCSPARPVSANRGSRPRCWNASPPSRTRACAISARRSTPTARFIRSSARWNVPPDWRTTTHRKRSSTSSMRCWRRPRPRQDAALFAEMLSLPNDGRYPALDLDPAAAQAKNAGSPDLTTCGIGKPATGADDLRGCALDRPHEPGSASVGRWTGLKLFRRCSS